MSADEPQLQREPNITESGSRAASARRFEVSEKSGIVISCVKTVIRLSERRLSKVLGIEGVNGYEG